jgi:phenylacetate-coenzyme A ligase PaaK-like adenylate-forming protein
VENLTFSHIAWDAWRATHGGPAAVAVCQRRRLAELVAFVRQHSRFYADKFRGLPEHVVQPLIRYVMGDSVTVNPAPCACGSPLPTIHVERRHPRQSSEGLIR